MRLTQYSVASANPKNRMRLAKALGLHARATIDEIVTAANAQATSSCRWPCHPADGPQCVACAARWGGL